MGTVNQPTNLLDRILALEREVAQLRKKTGLGNATVSHGNFDIIDGGTLRVINPDGDIVSRIGFLGLIGGQPVWGAQLLRNDGTEAVFVYASSVAQFAWLRDSNQNIIFSDNSGGEGIATPHISYGVPVPTGAGFWQTTAATSFGTILSSVGPATHPRVRISASFFGTGTTGTGRFLINGTSVASVAIPNGSFVDLNTTVDMPGWGTTATYDSEATFELQALCAVAGHSVAGQVFGLYGTQI